MIKMVNTLKTLALGLGIAACAGQAHAGEGQGTLDRDAIREVVRANIDEIRGCYNEALARDAEAQGRVVIDFTIAEDGAVTGAKVAESSMRDAEAPACMRDKIAGWAFPQPSGGAVQVSYPFVLEPG